MLARSRVTLQFSRATSQTLLVLVWVSEDGDHASFIDRAPKHLQELLNFLRDGEHGVPPSEGTQAWCELRQVRAEGLRDECARDWC